MNIVITTKKHPADLDDLMIDSEDRTKKARAALKAVNGRASSFAITEKHHVIAACARVDEALTNRGVGKTALIGTVFSFTPAGPSKANKYTAKSTRITCKLVNDGWRMIGAEAVEIYPGNPERLEITATKAAIRQIGTHVFSGIKMEEN